MDVIDSGQKLQREINSWCGTNRIPVTLLKQILDGLQFAADFTHRQ